MTYPTRIDLTVTINGTEIQEWIDLEKGITFSDVLTHQVNTGSFMMDYDGPPTPVEWQELIIYDGSEKIFGGILLDVEDDEEDGIRFWRIDFSDYTVCLDKKIVKEQYEEKTDAEILKALFEKYLPTFDAATYVSSLRTHDRVQYNRITVRDCLDKLASLSGADWYIDYDKKLHYFSEEEFSSPFSLSNSPDLINSFPFSGLKIRDQGEGIVNRVEVVGGYYPSEDTDFYLDGNGYENRISLPFRLQAPEGYSAIRVWRNDGTELIPTWMEMTVKVGYIDSLSGSGDVLYYYQEQVLEQQNPWPNLPNAVKVTARYEVPLRVRVTDNASYELYQEWFDGKIVDPNIISREEAKLAGKTFLAKESLAKRAIRISILKSGLRSGHILRITATNRDLDADFLVQKIAMGIGLGGYPIYDLELGVYNPDLIDMMVALNRNMKKEDIWRDDEVLDELLETFEELPLVESVGAVETSAGPYVWGPGGNVRKWGFGRWT
jgi:hypothetical protein